MESRRPSIRLARYGQPRQCGDMAESSARPPLLWLLGLTPPCCRCGGGCHELGLGCPANHSASFTPTWRISNVTSTSVYIDYLKVTFRPARNARYTHSTLVDGNANAKWAGNWAETSVSTSIAKTYYLRRTVAWGSARQVDVNQWFGFNSTAQAICSADNRVVFRLRKP